MKKPSPAANQFIRAIFYKFKYFAKKGKLNEDGSFYYDDKRLAYEQGVSPKTILRAKRYWGEAGYIKIENGKFRGFATKYWMLVKPDKVSPFWKGMSMTNSLRKDDKLSFKGCQSVTPNNEIINKQTKHLYLPSSLFEDVFKEQKKDKIATKLYFQDLGYTEAQCEVAFEGFMKSKTKNNA